MSKERLKVTDKRMFSADGTLREEYRFLEEEGVQPPQEEAVPLAGSGSNSPGEPVSASSSSASTGTGSGAGTGADTGEASAGPPVGAPDGAPNEGRFEIPMPAESMGGPTFLDLVSMLAEPIAIFLGDATLPDGSHQEDLHMARLHIDLLDLLRQKTQGNLSAQEAGLLEDLLYRLRMRYVQKRG
ncbi:MAG: DUF1844 domain-containing protein [Deltaproteobacteria bacterium]|nr:DUF1844 domain-containing protein [Deltaproteobacteria bacterium]